QILAWKCFIGTHNKTSVGCACVGAKRVQVRVQVQFVSVRGASSCTSDEVRTTIGVVGAPKRVTTCLIHCAVDWLNQPRCWPQSAQLNEPACGPLPGPIMQMFRQHGFSRSTTRSSLTLIPVKPPVLGGAPNMSCCALTLPSLVR